MNMPDYQAFVERTYRNKWLHTMKFAVIVLLVCLAIIIPVLTIGRYSIEKRQVLRDAKNIVRNVDLLMITYGQTNDFLTNTRLSGLTEEAEAQVNSYAGADGYFILDTWDKVNNRTSHLTYYCGSFYIDYTCNEDGKGVYEVFWKLQEYTRE